MWIEPSSHQYILHVNNLWSSRCNPEKDCLRWHWLFNQAWMGLSEIRHINNAITISVLSFVSRCSHLSCRLRRFDCLLLVFFRRWGRLVMQNHLYHAGGLWLVHFDPHWSVVVPSVRPGETSGDQTVSISAEKKHLSSVLVSNGYPSSFVQKISKARTAPKKEPVAEFKSTAVLPYVQGVSEPLRRCQQGQQDIRTVFKSEMTLRLHLVRPKDTIDRLNKMAWYTGFLMNAEKSISGKQKDLCMRESKNTTGIYNLPVPRPPPFLNTPTRLAITRFGTR